MNQGADRERARELVNRGCRHCAEPALMDGEKPGACVECIAQALREEREAATLRERERCAGLRSAAIRWWSSKRPNNRNLTAHLKEPRVNCVTDAECRLADAVAAAIRAPEGE